MGRISDIASGKTSIGGGRLSGVVSSESAVNEKNKYYLEVQKKSRYEEAIKKAQKAQEEAQKAAENLKFWEGIAGIPKQIYQAGKETGAAVIDVASRLSPLENVRNTYSGLSNVINGPSNVPADLRYEQGFQESKGRKTLFEKVSGKELTNPDGSINWDAGRQFIGRAAEAPTYIYAGAAQGAELVAKGLLTRILTRTAKSLPEASVNTGIQQFEQGNTENIGTNFLANALLLSGISNIAGEVRFSKEVAKKTISDIESELGTLSLPEKADVLESIKQGVKPADIVENVRKIKNNEVTPEELASKINEQAGIKETVSESKTVFRGRDATVDETSAPYRFFTESEQSAGKYADIKKTPEGKPEVISEKIDAAKYKLVDAKDYLDELQNKETIDNFDGVKFREPNGEMAYAKITKEQKPIDTSLPEQQKTEVKTTQEDPLIQEARKYKSAEEFVKAKSTVWRGGSGYHPAKINPSDGVSFSYDKKIGERFSEMARARGGSGPLQSFYVEPWAKILQQKDIPKNLLNSEYDMVAYAKKNGYDAIHFDSLGQYKESELRVVNPKVIKDKWELTDIWKKAQEKPIDTSLPEQPKPDVTPTTVEKGESVTAKKMNERFGKDEQMSTEYDVIGINNESDKAASLILKDRNKAIKTAFTDTGSNTEKIAILNELFEKSVVDNDHELSTVLFNRIKQLSTQTAQSLNMFKALTEVNPHYTYMSEVVNARLNGVRLSAGNIMDVLKKESKQSRVRTKVSKQTKELKETLSNSVKYERAQKVFNDLICK